MINKYNKEDLYKMDAIDIYKLVLEGKYIKIFPKGFWQQPEALNNAKIITQYLIEEKLKWSDEEIKEQLSVKVLKENGLGGMSLCCFNSSPFKAIDHAYPNKFNAWEFPFVPSNYWSDVNNGVEHGIKATKWLIEEKLKLSDEELKEQLSKKLFIENKMGSMLNICFNNSPYRAISLAYPNKFKPWEFKMSPMGYWKDVNNGIEATKWLIEERLKLNKIQIKEQLSIKLFKENNLIGMLSNCFNDSPYEAINMAYPNEFKPWEFSCVGQGYWQNEDNRRLAIKWLIEEKLQLSDEEIKKQVSFKLFKDNGLKGLLSCYFNGSPFEAINFAYPNKFKKSDF